MEKELLKLCREFIDKQNISFPERIYQSDNVIVNAFEFIQGICEIVGYKAVDEDE